MNSSYYSTYGGSWCRITKENTVPPPDVSRVYIRKELSTSTIQQVLDHLPNNTCIELLNIEAQPGLSLKHLTSVKEVTIIADSVLDCIPLLREFPPNCSHLAVFAKNFYPQDGMSTFNQALVQLRDQLVHFDVYVSYWIFVDALLLMPKLKYSVVGIRDWSARPVLTQILELRDKQRKQIALIHSSLPQLAGSWTLGMLFYQMI